MRVKSTVLVCVIGLVALVGCSKTPTPTAASSAESSPTSLTTSPAASTQGYPELLAVVSNTQSAVESNDFAKAQDEFDKFEGVWSQVEDGIKEKSSTSYDAIEQDMDQVNAALKASESSQAIAALQAMHDHIQSIP